MDLVRYMPAGTVGVDSAGFVHLSWGPGSQDCAAARAVFDEVLRLLQVSGCHKLLTDQRRRAPATEEYMGWLLVDWLPRAGTNQLLTQVAVVAARPLHLRLQSLDISSEGQRRYGIVTRYFDGLEEARQWLQGTNRPPVVS
ncbi:hypothetical protein [Hymenobacter glacieicola]|uniref:STAS/SEC14 domain-containing protein n=1 Tax=Hymenobacter glacieicola TaxID=1562124 RepID=A0ABQ1X910_9BACT|nr:hypothetical protein [Hymenobacter glacieicola]GGG61713.1 hypothetical protein GCM10011378_42200 [Hymenobacter glacieicola]